MFPYWEHASAAGSRSPVEITGFIVSFDFRRQIAFVKFIGSHAEYDRSMR
jgi:mRNA-degrading endonuclease HigB of HigAB toxin-antitoxin module